MPLLFVFFVINKYLIGAAVKLKNLPSYSAFICLFLAWLILTVSVDHQWFPKMASPPQHWTLCSWAGVSSPHLFSHSLPSVGASLFSRYGWWHCLVVGAPWSLFPCVLVHVSPSLGCVLPLCCKDFPGSSYSFPSPSHELSLSSGSLVPFSIWNQDMNIRCSLPHSYQYSGPCQQAVGTTHTHTFLYWCVMKTITSTSNTDWAYSIFIGSLLLGLLPKGPVWLSFFSIYCPTCSVSQGVVNVLVLWDQYPLCKWFVLCWVFHGIGSAPYLGHLPHQDRLRATYLIRTDPWIMWKSRLKC